MPHYRYRALTKAGEIILGDVDAPSREEVLRRIEYLGHLPVEAEVAAAAVASAAAAAAMRRTASAPSDAARAICIGSMMKSFEMRGRGRSLASTYCRDERRSTAEPPYVSLSTAT